MEPQLIDYYNELPAVVSTIDKLNDEYVEVLKKYDDLKKKYDDLTILDNPPLVKVNSVNEFIIDYENKLKNLENIIKDVFNSEIFKGINDSPPMHGISYGISRSLKYDGDVDDVKGIFFPIYNEMNIITNKQNPEWCKIKLKDILDKLGQIEGNFGYAKHYIRNQLNRDNIEESCTRYEIPPGKWISSELNIENMIQFMINNIIGVEGALSDTNVIAGLRIFNCGNCGQEDTYIPEDDDNMLYCGDCHPHNQY